MRKILRQNVNELLNLLKVGIVNLKTSLSFIFNRNRYKEALHDLPENTTIDNREKKLDQQEIRTRQQLRELEETRARIKYLRAQLHTFGEGGDHNK